MEREDATSVVKKEKKRIKSKRAAALSKGNHPHDPPMGFHCKGKERKYQSHKKGAIFRRY